MCQNDSIIHLEMINILVALKVWPYQCKDKKIQVKCDNMVVVEVLTSGKTKDATLGACARKIFIKYSMKILGTKQKWKLKEIKRNQVNFRRLEAQWVEGSQVCDPLADLISEFMISIIAQQNVFR